MRLKGRVAVITGAGHGLGKAIGLRFASEGAALAVTGPTEDTVQIAAKEIRDSGGRALACVTDVSDEASVASMVALALKEFGRIDILVNNAGIIGPTAPVTRVERADWDETLAVNLTGAFLCAKHVLPIMIDQRGGRIINIASVAGLHAYALRSPYSVSKWGMVG
ncbi:MAG TPA: SDR family NAD(P)-dependent oxidoreductase, partial [Blastocatellia bacterium]|nr:SDR family NAD(P)-dependent oxidoreductase [Blastocatellia bacterium]